MVELEYILDENKMHEDVEAGFPDEMKAALLETYFEFPVRFSVKGIELLEWPSPSIKVFQVDASGNIKIDVNKLGQPLLTPWRSNPILSIATICFDEVRKACRGEESVFEIPGGAGLVFKKVNSNIKIYSTINSKSAEADCSELIEAFTIFSDRARTFVENLFPQLITDQLWECWFK